MLKILWALISPLIALWGVEINPYVMEWGTHYIGGSKKTKQLPPSLIEITLCHLVWSLNNLNGVANCYDEGEISRYDWYRHPTAGVVGDFGYKLVEWEDKFVFQCWDIWDFNTDKDYYIALPPGVDVAVLKAILRRFKVPVTSCNLGLSIEEGWLASFNKNHAFRTEWVVVIDYPLFCDLEEDKPF